MSAIANYAFQVSDIKKNLHQSHLWDGFVPLHAFSLYGPLKSCLFCFGIRNPRWPPLQDKVLTQDHMRK
jgi:hypothetical protein